MYPLNFLMKNLFVEFRNPHFEYKIVRWKRAVGKPFWLPMAKTKQFVPPKVTEPDPVEDVELKRLNDIYDIHLHSLRTFMYNDESFSITAESSKFVEPEKNIQASLVKNDEWNRKSAELRIARLERIKQEEEDKAIQTVEERENTKKARREKIARIARIELEKSKAYIKRENIDKAVEECLESIVSHNYAIDIKGNVYKNNEVVDNLNRKKEVEQVSQ